MPHFPKPFYREPLKHWYVEIAKKQRPLGWEENPQLDEAGKPIPPPDIVERYYEIMAEEGRPVPEFVSKRYGREPLGTPKDDYVGLRDLYFAVMVGPCARDEIERQVTCPLVEEIITAEHDQFECTYEEWVSVLRDTVHQAAALGWPGTPDPHVLLNDKHRAQAALAAQTGAPIELEGGQRIIKEDDGWILFGDNGKLLIELPIPSWDYFDDFRDSAVRFRTPYEAIAGALLADAVERSREFNRKTAFKKLGRDDPVVFQPG
jgi:hypothetical protein